MLCCTGISDRLSINRCFHVPRWFLINTFLCDSPCPLRHRSGAMKLTLNIDVSLRNCQLVMKSQDIIVVWTNCCPNCKHSSVYYFRPASYVLPQFSRFQRRRQLLRPRKMPLSPLHRETDWSKIGGKFCENFQFLIISAVKVCRPKQCLQTASASGWLCPPNSLSRLHGPWTALGDFRPTGPWDTTLPNDNSWRRHWSICLSAGLLRKLLLNIHDNVSQVCKALGKTTFWLDVGSIPIRIQELVYTLSLTLRRWSSSVQWNSP